MDICDFGLRDLHSGSTKCFLVNTAIRSECLHRDLLVEVPSGSDTIQCYPVRDHSLSTVFKGLFYQSQLFPENS